MTDKPVPPLSRVALIGAYLPRQCGIATFTHDVYHSAVGPGSGIDGLVVPVNDREEGYAYPPEIRFEIPQEDLAGYRRAADFIRLSDVDVLCLQHEFGIYGGPAGSHILALLRQADLPTVTVLHTILDEPDDAQREVFGEILHLSSRLIVMTERSRTMLGELYGAPKGKIDLIPHGIPDMPFVDPHFYKEPFGVEGRRVILTFGLLSPGKGIEHMLRALPAIVKEFPEVVYMVLGATHPHLLREQGEAYRLRLERLTADLGVEDHVIFYNRFVDAGELKQFLGAADLYVTPYLNPRQAVSGTLAYAFGCGKAVVSTPYWHAEELLADGRGVLVPFADPDALAGAVLGLLRDEVRMHAMRRKAYLLGRDMIWPAVGEAYRASFARAREAYRRQRPRRYVAPTVSERKADLPDLRLDHLRRLSDTTGILQHAVFSFPNYDHGYCVDDNARALVLTVLLERLGRRSAAILDLQTAYAAFIQHAYHPERGRFRNFMGYDRRWLEDAGSEDSHGRTLWALGCCAGRAQRPALQHWATQLFEQALPAVEAFTSPRAWAFTLLGIQDYLQRLSGDRRVETTRRELLRRLLGMFPDEPEAEWLWYEPILSYANARVPHALIQAGRWTCDERAFEVGVRSLRWLMDQQRSASGCFSPVGSEGFFPQGGPRARWDQQPVEAQSALSACIEAYYATEDPDWLAEARRAFDWFLGRNDLGEPVGDPVTGACFDALHVDRVNQNQGAESTLAWLMALAEMRLLQDSLGAFERPVKLESRPPEAPAAAPG